MRTRFTLLHFAFFKAIAFLLAQRGPVPMIWLAAILFGVAVSYPTF